jgi:hypothetical protein
MAKAKKTKKRAYPKAKLRFWDRVARGWKKLFSSAWSK